MLVLVWWIANYYLLNNYNYSLPTLPYKFNNLLINPLNKYHPLIFFTAYIFFFRFFVYTNLYTHNRNSGHHPKINLVLYKNTVSKLRVFWVIILYSLYLGSWWAIQEGSWGGWWNWDSSEVFGLLILCFFVLYLHGKYSRTVYVSHTITLLTWTTLIAFLYTMLQISYTLVSHNFGLSILYYGYTSFNFSTISILLLFLSSLSFMLWFYLCTKYYNLLALLNTNHYPLRSYLNGTNMIKYVCTVVTVYVLYSSFNPIFNNFLWTSLNLNVLNSLYTLWKPQLIFVLFIYLNFFLINSLSYPLTLILYYNLTFKLSFILVQFGTKAFDKSLHLTILVIMSLPLYLSSSVFVLWDYTTANATPPHFNKCRNFYTTTLNVNSLYISHLFVMLYDTLNLETVNSVYWINSDTVSQTFLLSGENTLLCQVVANTTFLYLFCVYVYDFATFTLDFIFLYSSLVIIFLLNWKNKLII